MSIENPFAAVEPAELHTDWTMADYLADPGVSRSPLWTLHHRSPYEMRWDLDHGSEEETDSMRLGTALHLAILEPEKEGAVVCYPKTRRGAEWEAFQGEHAGAVILTKAQWETFERIRAYAASLKGVRSMLSQGQAEQTITWTDAHTGERVKCRPDFLALHGDEAVVVDLKTTSADIHNPYALMRKAEDLGYHVQSAMIRAGLSALGYKQRDSWTLWVRTTGAPLARMTSWLPEALDDGERIYREALATYAECRRTDEWPMPKFKMEPLPWREER